MEVGDRPGKPIPRIMGPAAKGLDDLITELRDLVERIRLDLLRTKLQFGAAATMAAQLITVRQGAGRCSAEDLIEFVRDAAGMRRCDATTFAAAEAVWLDLPDGSIDDEVLGRVVLVRAVTGLYVANDVVQAIRLLYERLRARSAERLMLLVGRIEAEQLLNAVPVWSARTGAAEKTTS